MSTKLLKRRSASIQWRLVFIYVLVIVVVMQAVSFYLISNIQKMLEGSFEKRIQDNSHVLANRLRDNISDTEYVSRIIEDELKYQRPNDDSSNAAVDKYNILLFNNEKKLIYGPSDDFLYWSDDVLINAELSDDNYYTKIKKNVTDQNKRYLISCEKIVSDEITLGYLYTIAAMENQVYKNVNQIRSTMLMGTMITLVISMILSLALAGTITKPIKQLTLSAAEMARGNFSQEIEVHSNDEIGHLGDMFNSMARQLSQTLGEISNEKSKMDAIFTYMSNGVIAFDINGELIHINPLAKELLVLPNKEAHLLVPEIIEKLEINKIEQTAKMDRLIVKEITLPYDGGRTIRMQQAPFKREKQHNGVIMVLEDVTEQQKLERMRREFIANVSHELKTPLTNIQVRIQTLQEYITEKKLTPIQLINIIKAGWRMLNINRDRVKQLLPGDAFDEYDLTYEQLKELYAWQIESIQRKMLPDIVSETTRMNKLVRDLLQLSQLDSEHVKFNKRRFSINSLLEQVVERMQATAKEKSTIITYEAKPDMPEVFADSDTIEQVAYNVLSNAIKYSPNDSEINVTLTREDSFAVVSIHDNGIGIPAEDLPRIFERFYRVDKARSRRLGGTGLGLSIAKEIIETHGGHIDIFSIMGEGTEVRFTLPFVKAVDGVL
ncbi:HAMP domain-containing protein [Clostridium sp. 'deep sea']|uniref:ATP-binding protein n=1 Tax=Clostridium sp. 'deep sea' TaxID=2779445 RepID=UPI00189668C9|nr:ATP-binding protein [Clostridium sp. 'deep sea']QOR34164.1 HAMP domain-containing protein [Clostridium sp. 'deep sea']